MAKRQPRETVCSFCIQTILDRDAYSVVLPMHRLEGGDYSGEYYTPCCEKCLGKKETKERILRVKEEPKSKQPPKPRKTAAKKKSTSKKKK